MALKLKLEVYRGLKAALGSLASTGAAGVLAYTTDSQELYVDSGTGTGIGPGNAWLRVAADNAVTTDANQAARLAEANALLGDISVQTDTGVSYMLTALPSSVNGNWTAIGNTGTSDVTSVNSIGPVLGNVSLTLDDIPDGATYGRLLLATLTDGEFDLAKSHQFGFTNDNLIQPSGLGTWAALTAYTKGQVITDPTNAGKIQQVVVAGTSGTPTPPSFSNTKGVTTVDAGVTWENIGTSLRVSVKWAASATSNEFVTYIDNDGVQHIAQPALAGLSDVNITSIANFQLLQYDSGTSKWLNTSTLDCGTF